ncbi:hypothetical protein [Rubripirellula reticaptiva]|uniref:Uncharacterized protein n=1 Tax=Rubripirellula reticaptiva TaxID=2528013 RepID=A0A5C6ETY8_9BACT|nr:hypothetical protein [Rubripirellula reticaptiva]TWU51770.1 hypothetical protein Poly59_33650 [Rubripirellula reticaptiva]
MNTGTDVIRANQHLRVGLHLHLHLHLQAMTKTGCSEREKAIEIVLDALIDPPSMDCVYPADTHLRNDVSMEFVTVRIVFFPCTPTTSLRHLV